MFKFHLTNTPSHAMRFRHFNASFQRSSAPVLALARSPRQNEESLAVLRRRKGHALGGETIVTLHEDIIRAKEEGAAHENTLQGKQDPKSTKANHCLRYTRIPPTRRRQSVNFPGPEILPGD